MRIFAIATVAFAAFAAPALAASSILYAPTQSPAELLSASPWNWNFTAINGGTQATNAGGGTVLDTMTSLTNTAQAGFNISNGGSYNNALMPTLSAAAGYDIRFTLALQSEDHSGNNDRAGFSIIAIPGSATSAIELGFHTDQIFSQNDNFVGHADQVAFNTTVLTTYDLIVQGTTYTLKTGGTTLLQGNLHTYNANPLPGALLTNALYSQTNWIFLGDDTTSAGGISQITHVEILPTPEPSSLALLGFAVIPLLRRRK